jgi:hypothetical protein
VSEPIAITEHTHDTDHVAQALASLASQFRRPAIEAIATTWASQAQEIEDALWELYALGIDDSEAHALDQLGWLFRQPRAVDMTDAVYRRVLRGCVEARRSGGRGPGVVATMRALVGGDEFTLREVFPAAFIAEPDESTSIPVEIMRAVLARAKAAGVGLAVLDVPTGDALLCAPSMMSIYAGDPDHGFSDTTQAAGGALVGVM